VAAVRKEVVIMNSLGRVDRALASWGALVACVVSMGIAGCGDEVKASEAFVVESLDGVARISVPAGALPRGTAASEVTLTRLEAASLDPLVPRFTAAAAYELGPDGLVLSEPATLSVRVTAAEYEPYLVVHVSRSDSGAAVLETPEPTWVRLSAAQSTTYTHEVRIPVAHFSRVEVLVGETDMYSAAVAIDATDTVVGGTTAVGLTESTLSGSLDFGMGCVEGATASTAFVRSWTSASMLEPSRIDFLDPPSPDISATFRPTQAGSLSVDAELSLQFVTQRTCAGEQLPTPWWVPIFRASTPIHNVVAAMVDAILDYIDSISTNPTTFESVRNDLQAFGATRYVESLAGANARFNNSVLECGTTRDDGTITVCPTGVLDVPEGDVYVVTSTLTGPLPSAGNDDGHHFIYSVVFDSDGDPTNDWQFNPPFDWDYFLGTDRWYQLMWNPDTTAWSLTVTQVDATQATAASASAVRAALNGDTVTWFIPAVELPAVQPGYRVTAFGHDGAYSESDRGGDVSGADPTEPLTLLPAP
jgi:hypothetical protein